VYSNICISTSIYLSHYRVFLGEDDYYPHIHYNFILSYFSLVSNLTKITSVVVIHSIYLSFYFRYRLAVYTEGFF